VILDVGGSSPLARPIPSLKPRGSFKVQSILETIRAQNRDLDPIIILAPTQRCGTTLLQRAMNAGGDAIIVGENFFLLEKFPMNVANCFTGEFEKRKIVEATKQEFLAGNTGIDGSALFLGYEDYLHKVAGDFYGLLRHYKDAAAKHGFKAWGFKHQTRDAGSTLTFLRLVPNARVVFTTRHVFHTAASFMGRWPQFMDTPEKIAVFGRQWAAGMAVKSKITNPMLFFKYEDMVADTESYRKKIEEFLGVRLAAEQFGIKVNAHVESGKREEVKKGGIYIPPASLKEEHLAILRQQAGPMLESLGYSTAAAA
jgi:hypothetical protein